MKPRGAENCNFSQTGHFDVAAPHMTYQNPSFMERAAFDRLHAKQVFVAQEVGFAENARKHL